jgi:coenzyme PQQ precursor peptide PqqA
VRGQHINLYPLVGSTSIIGHEVLCSKAEFPFRQPKGGADMRQWKRPKVIEIAVGMEINCYACAEL